MNPWQLSQQIKHKLATVRWPGVGGSVVFGSRSVFVYAGAPPTEEELPAGLPFALITIEAGEPDADAPDLLQQTFSIATAVEVTGDPLGEFAVIGGARASLFESAGAGVAEVAERVRSAIQQLTGADGASLVVSASGTGSSNTIGDGRHLAFDEFQLTALCTSQPVYAAPQQLSEAGGIWSWTADNVTPRFDFLQYRLGYVAGSTPVATPGELDAVVYTGTELENNGGTTAGRTYQVFADYAPRGTGAVEYSSNGTAKGAYLTL